MSLATSLYDALTHINIPKDQAREVVEALETKMTAEFATKSDIALVRGDLAMVRTELKSDIDKLRTELKSDIDKLRTETKADIDQLRSELATVRRDMSAEFVAVRREMAAEFAAVRSEMKALENRLLIKLGALIVVLLGVLPEVRAWLAG
jgi:uncharacterized protein involved in exopolysaccharide biosynthesis